MDEISSTTQDGLQELAQALQVQVTKAAGLAGAMTPDDLNQLVEAAQKVYWLQLNAATFDKRVELEMARITAD